MKCENSPATEELFLLFGGEFDQVVPSSWLLLALQNVFIF